MALSRRAARGRILARSRQLLLKRPLDDLLKPTRQGAAEEIPQEGEVAGRVHMLLIDRHFDPESGPVDTDFVAVGTPLDPLDHRPEQAADLVDRRLQAGACFLESSAVLDGNID